MCVCVCVCVCVGGGGVVVDSCQGAHGGIGVGIISYIFLVVFLSFVLSCPLSFLKVTRA